MPPTFYFRVVNESSSSQLVLSSESLYRSLMSISITVCLTGCCRDIHFVTADGATSTYYTVDSRQVLFGKIQVHT